MLFRTTNTIALFACVAHAFHLSSNHYGPSSMTSTGTKMSSFESEIGAQAPLGFWDPLEILQDADQERFYRLRTVELKHGRISMLAFLGHVITAAGMRWPGEVAFGAKFADMKTGLAAFDTIPSAGIFQIVVFIGAMELGFKACKKNLESYCETKFPGLTQTRRKAVELNNGRAAQMGILALMVHEKLDNNPYMLNSLIGASINFNNGL